MIKIIQTKLESKIDKKLLEIKGEIRTQGESKLNEYKKKLSSPEEIKALLKPYLDDHSGIACSIQGQAQMEKLYKKLKRALEKVQSVTTKTKSKIDNIQSKLDNIKDNVLPSITKILGILASLVTAANAIVKALPIAMSFMVGWSANGATIKKLGDLIDKAKGKIGQFKNAIKAFTTVVNKNVQKVIKFTKILAPVIMAITALLTLIISLIAMLELLYLKFLQMCNIGNQDPLDIDGNINEDLLGTSINEDLLGTGEINIDVLTELGSNIMDNLGLSGNEEVIEKMYNANFQVMGYRRYKI
tara:strand:+ start:216 stop:1118 length:903 start_codon:yes stop_codon:yes gene_type:complete